MRLNFVLFVFVLSTLNLDAQVQFGIKGFQAASYTAEVAEEYVNLSPLAIHKIAHKGASTKKGLGMSIYADNAKLFFMSNVQYAISNNEFALQSVNYSRTPLDPEVVFASTQEDIRLSVLAGVKVKNFKIGFGPEWSKTLSLKEELSNMNEVSRDESNMGSGFNFLLGYIILDHIHVDLKHTYIFQDVSNGYSYQGIPLDIGSNHKYVELSVGLYF